MYVSNLRDFIKNNSCTPCVPMFVLVIELKKELLSRIADKRKKNYCLSRGRSPILDIGLELACNRGSYGENHSKEINVFFIH